MRTIKYLTKHHPSKERKQRTLEKRNEQKEHIIHKVSQEKRFLTFTGYILHSGQSNTIIK